MKIENALLLLLKKEVPEHIINHSLKVTKVAYIITSELMDAGVNVNCKLVVLSSLLHDITKYQSILNRGEDHSQTGGELLRELGYPEIAEIIESHIIIKNAKNLILEKMIVFYSDKRVKHDKVVSLKERYDDLIVRYAKTAYSEKMIRSGLERALDVEKKIFEKLKFKPENLNIL